MNRFKQSIAAIEQSAPTEITPRNALDSVDIPQNTRGRAATYYLSREIAEAVENEAKRRRINKSKLVNCILKKFLSTS
jgi:hypothetical protein